MKLMKRGVCMLLASALVLGLAACGGKASETPTTVQKDNPVVEALPENSEGKNVVYSNGGPEEFFETPWLNPGTFFYNRAIYSHLIVADENLIPIPDHPDALATYEYSEDGKTLTFHIRDDAFWHNGEKITAEDVKWSIEFVSKTPVCNAVFVTTFSAIEGAKTDGKFNETFSGITADGQDLVITFDKIAPDALLTFTQFAPVPKSEFEGVDPLQVQQAAFFQHPIGSGPFKVDTVNMKNYTILKPFEKFYNGVADFDIQLLPSAGDSDPNLVTRVKSGNLDYGFTKMVSDLQAIEGTQGINVTPIDVRYTRLLYVNKFARKDGTPAPLADARVRQAIAYAIDMDTICETLFQGAAVPANSLTPDANLKDDSLENYKYNPEKARELLAEAKWDSSTVLKTVFYYTDQTTVDLMTAIQAYLAEVGIKMEFELVEGDLGALLWSAPADQTNGPRVVDWDMCYAAVGALSLHEYYDRHRTGSPTNSHTPEDAKLNELIDATNASSDVNVQNDAFKELIRYENENLFSIPLYYQPLFLITSDKIGDIHQGTPQFCYNWDVQHWDVK